MEPIDLTNARPDPDWQQKKKLGWDVLAETTIEILQQYDNENSTYYAYYLNEVGGPKMLSKALEQANRKLVWTEVPNDGGHPNRAQRRQH